VRSLVVVGLVCSWLCAPAVAQPSAVRDANAPTERRMSPVERRALARADRCAGEIKAHLNAERLSRARRALDRCAADGDPRWAWLAALLVPGELTVLVAPSPELRADVERVRARVAATSATSFVDERDMLARLGAWMALVAGEDVWIEVGPQDPEGAAWLRRAGALRWRRGQRLDAERALRLAVSSMPQDPELARDLAAIEVARGRADDAAARLGIARGGSPDDRRLRLEQALAWLAAGRGDEALGLFEALARDADPETHGEDLLRLATARLELGHASRAEVVAREAVERLPVERRAEAHAVRGLALLALGRRAEARVALSIAEDDVRARSALEALDAP
jgi:Flp pilus assembly protein TadD